jgi:hypothetical protein
MIRHISRVREFPAPAIGVDIVTSDEANRFQYVRLCHSNPLAAEDLP